MANWIDDPQQAGGNWIDAGQGEIGPSAGPATEPALPPPRQSLEEQDAADLSAWQERQKQSHLSLGAKVTPEMLTSQMGGASAGQPNIPPVAQPPLIDPENPDALSMRYTGIDPAEPRPAPRVKPSTKASENVLADLNLKYPGGKNFDPREVNIYKAAVQNLSEEKAAGRYDDAKGFLDYATRQMMPKLPAQAMRNPTLAEESAERYGLRESSDLGPRPEPR